MRYEEALEMRLQLHDWLARSVQAFQVARRQQHPTMFVLRRQVQDALYEIKRFDKGARK